MPETSIVTLLERLLDRQNISTALAAGIITPEQATRALDDLEEREQAKAHH